MNHDRTMPKAHNEEIELYIRTYYSLLRNGEPIRIRSLEETHTAINSNLHQLAMSPDVDVSALLYSALRLPECLTTTKLIVMGQMADVFRREGLSRCGKLATRQGKSPPPQILLRSAEWHTCRTDCQCKAI